MGGGGGGGVSLTVNVQFNAYGCFCDNHRTREELIKVIFTTRETTYTKNVIRLLD